MEIINNLKEIFSNRELATIVWGLIILVLMNLKKEIRKSFFSVIKAFFVDKILYVIFSLTIYTFLIVLILKYFKFWDFSLIKDTMFWSFGFLFMMLFNLNEATEESFFWKILKDNFKTIIFLEFFLNFYNFSFITEMIILPIFTMIFLMNLISETKSEFRPVAKLTKVVLGFIGLYYLMVAIYKFIFHNDNILSTHNLMGFVLPLLLTVLCAPFFYLTALYSNYENLFKRVKFMNKNTQIQRKLKIQILKKANFNLYELKRIDQNLNGFDLFELTNINENNNNV